MTDIPGTTSTKSKKDIVKDDSSIQLKTVINIKSILMGKIKPTALNFNNKQFKNWVIVSSVLTLIFVLFLSLTSYKFLILAFSGPGIGVVSYYIKELATKHLKDNDSLIRRY